MRKIILVVLITSISFLPSILFAQEKTNKISGMNALISEAVELKLDGVVVSDKNGARKHSPSLKDKFNENSTVQDVVNILGPGFVSKYSGTGGITWFFDDGSKIFTSVFPISLNSKVKLKYLKPNSLSIKTSDQK